jgi:hypothetical protein
MLFIILTNNFPNALKFFVCILLMQIEHFSLIEQIHTNQCAYNCDTGSLVLEIPNALLYNTLPVDGSREPVTM